MQRRRFLLSTVACAATAASLTGCGGGVVTPEDFTLIAESSDDFRLIPEMPAIDDNGRVGFFGAANACVGDGVSPLLVFPPPRGRVTSIQLSSVGDIVFATDDIEGAQRLTVYHTRGGWLAPTAVFESPARGEWNVLRMADNGTLAIKASGAGTTRPDLLVRGPATGPFSVMAEPDGFFQGISDQFDVNNAGRLAVAMGYTDNGVNRAGVIVYQRPGETSDTVYATAQRLGSNLAQVAINNRGLVAFTVGRASIDFFDPRFPTPASGGTPIRSVTLEPGIYVATPRPLGEPFTYWQIASHADGYEGFVSVAINDYADVVFEAFVDGQFGIYHGRDPVRDRVASIGQEIEINKRMHRFSNMQLGQLNNRGQVAIATEDLDDRRVRIWRVDLSVSPTKV